MSRVCTITMRLAAWKNCRKMTGSFFDTMLETLRNTELDRDVMSCVLDGSWPSALEQITTTAKILGYKLVPLDSTT